MICFYWKAGVYTTVSSTEKFTLLLAAPERNHRKPAFISRVIWYYYLETNDKPKGKVLDESRSKNKTDDASQFTRRSGFLALWRN